jgi:hypothetical protein
MADFMYLFRGGDADWTTSSPERMQEHMNRWMGWMENLGKQGKLGGGEPLKREGKIVNSKGAITDGPYAEGKDIVGGYLLVKADTAHEAAELTKGCPVFEFGGTVEVREIQKM